MNDITAVIVFHAEDALATASLDSFHLVVAHSRAAGLHVQSILVMDSPTEITRGVVRQRRERGDELIEVEFRDLSRARNAGIIAGDGQWVAFFDGDDLWGTPWLTLAHQTASQHSADTIWHPEYLFYFSEKDFFSTSLTTAPSYLASSYFMRQASSRNPSFDRQAILFDNIWSAHALCRRELYLRHPYQPFERARGLGVEDWSWNTETLFAGIEHDIVRQTVHVIRVKESGSLGVLNSQQGLLPFLSERDRATFYERGS